MSRAQLELRLRNAEARAKSLELRLRNKTSQIVVLLDQIAALTAACDAYGLEVKFGELNESLEEQPAAVPGVVADPLDS